jgi:hypothetical protein
MTKELIEHSRKRREFTDMALIVTTVTLVVSLAIAFTVVSIGIARADTLLDDRSVAVTSSVRFG